MSEMLAAGEMDRVAAERDQLQADNARLRDLLARTTADADLWRQTLAEAHRYLRRLEDGAVGGVCRTMYESVRMQRLAAGHALGEKED